MLSQADRGFLVIISPDVDDPSWCSHVYECVAEAEWELDGEREEGGIGNCAQA